MTSHDDVIMMTSHPGNFINRGKATLRWHHNINDVTVVTSQHDVINENVTLLAGRSWNVPVWEDLRPLDVDYGRSLGAYRL